MKVKVLYLVIALGISGLMFVGGCGKKEEATKPTTQETPITQEKAVYTCVMHPEVVSDKPGKCPKCGMNLVEKE